MRSVSSRTWPGPAGSRLEALKAKEAWNGTGTVPYAGYYTIPLAEPVKVKPGERFAVTLKLHTPGAVHPMAIEYDSGDGRCLVDITDGEGIFKCGW